MRMIAKLGSFLKEQGIGIGLDGFLKILTKWLSAKGTPQTYHFFTEKQIKNNKQFKLKIAAKQL